MVVFEVFVAWPCKLPTDAADASSGPLIDYVVELSLDH